MPVEEAVSELQLPYVAAFERLEPELTQTSPRWLTDVRRSAIENFIGMGFPTSRLESWKFTNLNSLTRLSFERAGNHIDLERAEELVDGLSGDDYRLVLVNGRFVPELSSQSRSGLVLGSLHDALLHATDVIEPCLTRYADYRNHAFVALNTALFEDAAFVYAPKALIVDRPVHLIHIALSGRQPALRQQAMISHPRNLVVVAAAAQVSLVESYIGDRFSGAASYFANPVTEIVAGDDAVVDHYKLQQEGNEAFHIATVQAELGRGSNFRSHSFSLGAALARTELNAVLAEGSECTFNGLYVASGTQHVDTRTSIDHAKPHGTSHEFYKGILNGRSSAVFNGKIIVRKDAQKTDAKQTNKNLVLSESATINTKPELQIYADDVRCTHGATIGQLDADAIFYLRSRGVSGEEARQILTAAFAGEIVEGIRVKTLRNYVERGLISHIASERGAAA